MSFTPHIVGGAAQQVEPDRFAGVAQVLLDRGAVSEQDLEQAMLVQKRTGMGLDRVLVAEGLADAEEIAAALAAERGLGYANLRDEPPMRGLAVAGELETYLTYQIIPWRKVGAVTAYATAQPDRAQEALSHLKPDAGMAFCVVVSPEGLQDALMGLCGSDLAARASVRTPAALSVRSLDTARQNMLLALFAGTLSFVLVPPDILLILGILILILSLSTTIVRAAALLQSRRPSEPGKVDGALVLADHRPLPQMSVLIPLYDEPEMISRLLDGLSDVDYPLPLLDIKILLEEGDQATIEAVMSADLPPHVTMMVLPDGFPRTKPRALNIALDFCSGDIIGVLDAEDRPDPGQFREVAEYLRGAATDIGCVQCQLAFFNAPENWITRCFQIEYSIWFDVLLRGWQNLGLPIPLGGTSVYFRRRALQDLGGWDAHNVTEDADLGMRLARSGLKCAVLGSTTQEEANCRFIPWIRQRSRWLKGYMMTWLCHMRRPADLWRDLGPRGFLGFQILFLGGAISYLAMPVFWIALGLTVIFDTSIYGRSMPDWGLTVLGVTLLAGQFVMLAAAILALYRRHALGLVLWVPTLLLYWTMGAAAAWKAVLELGTAPYYWDKTRHGISRYKSEPDDEAPTRPKTSRSVRL